VGTDVEKARVLSRFGTEFRRQAPASRVPQM